MAEKKIRALLVDDNPEFLAFASRYLAADDCIAVTATARDGAEALELAAKLNPDLVLVDLAMPAMSGLEVARRLKKRPGGPRVVILTMYDNPQYVEEASRVGADGFVTKAELDEKLLPVIHALFAEKKPMQNILVVDDSKTMRKMVIASLGSLEGMAFREAASGLEAIEQLALHPVRLITLDLNMPDMHGLEVLQFLRSHERYRKIPVIVLTTKGDPDSRESALQAGAALYLTKPFNPAGLVREAARLLAESGERGVP